MDPIVHPSIHYLRKITSLIPSHGYRPTGCHVSKDSFYATYLGTLIDSRENVCAVRATDIINLFLGTHQYTATMKARIVQQTSQMEFLETFVHNAVQIMTHTDPSCTKVLTLTD